jgi:biopolymer transport protein ExbB
MKKIILVSLVLFSTCFTLPCQAEETWQNTAGKVISLAGQMEEKALFSERFALQDKAALEKKIAALKKNIAQNSRAVEQMNDSLNTLSATRAKLAEQYQREMADMKTVEGSFRNALRQTLSRLDTSTVAAMHPEIRQTIKALLAQDNFLGLKEMQTYTALLFEDIRATSRIEKKNTPVIKPNGQVQTVPLYRAGGFFLGYQTPEDAYFVLPQPGQPGLSVKAEGKQLTAWISGESDKLPMDITGGTAIMAAEQKQGLGSWVEAGGVLLYPILLAGLVGTLFSLFKALHLFMQKRLGPKRKEKFLDQAESSDQVRTALSKISRCPGARVMEACFSSQSRHIESLDAIVEEKILTEQGKQERFLSIIGVLASIAPLLGLLGTVTGMISTFRAITIFGTGDPRMMSTGISEALVTTQAGLAIAIPLLLAHHFLKRRVVVLVEDMEACGMGIIARISKGQMP